MVRNSVMPHSITLFLFILIKNNILYIKKFFSEYAIFQIGYGRFQPFKLGSCFCRPSGPEQCHRIDGSARGNEYTVQRELCDRTIIQDRKSTRSELQS